MKPIVGEYRALYICQRKLVNDDAEGAEGDGAEPVWDLDFLSIGSSDDAEIIPYFASCIYIATEWLHDPHSINCLAASAAFINAQHEDDNALPRWHGDERKAREWVEESFLQSIKKGFPVLYIDRQVIGVLGVTLRTYEAAYHHERNHVHLPQWQADTLREHLYNDDLPAVQRWMISVILTLMHEVGGHILVSKATMGRHNTPDGCPPGAESVPESGAEFERRLLGGWVTFGEDIAVSHRMELPIIHMANEEGEEQATVTMTQGQVQRILRRDFSQPLAGSATPVPVKEETTSEHGDDVSTRKLYALAELMVPEPGVMKADAEKNSLKVCVGKDATIHQVPFQLGIGVEVWEEDEQDVVLVGRMDTESSEE